jgi:hypothetical protein
MRKMEANVQKARRHGHMKVRADDQQLLGRCELGVLALGVAADLEVDRRDRPERGVFAENLVRAELASIDGVELGGTTRRVVRGFVGVRDRMSTLKKLEP